MHGIDQVADFLQRHDLLLTTAESATAGLIAAMLADVPGCARVLDCGFVTYSVDAKKSMLGVGAQIIENFGLTSEQVASEMAQGALQRSRANIALANTGMAAADNELDGVMCFACAARIDGQVRVVCETHRFPGGRNEVRTAAAQHALLRLPHYYQRLKREHPTTDRCPSID
nr:CinA family protein [uncultured Pseudomonas sp.]